MTTRLQPWFRIACTWVAACPLAGAAGTFPAAPPGATLATATFASPAAVPIPDLGVADSPILVSGLGGSVWDVNVVTNVVHQFNADLVVTLISPAGTEITLAYQVNTGLLGRTFDDRSEQVVSQSVASVVAPERGFSALVGEAPNGTWTLRCDDRIPLFDGIFTWQLEIATIDVEPVRHTTTYTSTAAGPLPGFTYVLSELQPSPGFVCDVEVLVHVAHPTPNKLAILLFSPDNRLCTLSVNRGTIQTFYANAVFDDASAALVGLANPAVPLGTVSPTTSLGIFTDVEAAGTWQLAIDNNSATPGTLLGWELRITTCEVPGPQTFCYGAAPAPCPCGNNGALGNGCANASHAGGARLTAIVPGSQARVGDDVVLSASDLDPFQLVLFVQGTQAAGGGTGVALGDGLLCATGQIVRLATRYSGFGSSSYPGLFDQRLSTRGMIPASGGTRVYQALFRSPLLFGPCHTGMNSTNGVRITWLPAAP